MSGPRPERACCFDPWFSLHSHTFSHYIPMPPADCADAVRAWFQCIEEANTGQSSEHVQTHSLVSDIASQNRICAIDTFDSSKITGHFLSPQGFRDNIELHLTSVASTSGGSICTSLSGVSYHNGHVCICFPLPLAFLCCCCNLCPTADHGANQRRVESLISFINSKAAVASPPADNTMCFTAGL